MNGRHRCIRDHGNLLLEFRDIQIMRESPSMMMSVRPFSIHNCRPLRKACIPASRAELAMVANAKA